METFISENETATIDFAKNFAKTLNLDDIVVLDGELGARQNQICARHFVLFWT